MYVYIHCIYIHAHLIHTRVRMYTYIYTHSLSLTLSLYLSFTHTLSQDKDPAFGVPRAEGREDGAPAAHAEDESRPAKSKGGPFGTTNRIASGKLPGSARPV